MSMPPPIMTTVRPQATMIRLTLSFSMSKICFAWRKPPPRNNTADRYMMKNMTMVMVISNCVSVSGSFLLNILKRFFILLFRSFHRYSLPALTDARHQLAEACLHDRGADDYQYNDDDGLVCLHIR